MWGQIWPKCVQVIRGASFWSDFLQNPYFSVPNLYTCTFISGKVWLLSSIDVKVRTFLETHKIWKTLPHGFDKSADSLSKHQNHKADFFQIRCASQKVWTLSKKFNEHFTCCVEFSSNFLIEAVKLVHSLLWYKGEIFEKMPKP